jgi:hypothetical protein
MIGLARSRFFIRALAVVAHQGAWARIAALALLVGVALPADAKTRADCEKEYTPERGQEGKDVVWVPTEDSMVVRMLEMAKVTPADKVYDLGAGDGKIAIAATKHFGATAVGVEYDPDLARHAQCLVGAEGVQDRVKIVQGDIFETNFSDATVVTLYLLPELNLRLRPTLLELKPGTRVVSYSFTMGDWDPDEQVETSNEGSAFLWIVPASVHGDWTFRSENSQDSFDVTLAQTFQHLEGSAGGARVTGTLSGASIAFALVQEESETRVTGTVDGDRIRATVTRGDGSTDYIGIRN